MLSWPRPPSRFLAAGAAATLLCFGADVAQALEWENPEPFRRERLQGRQFSYNSESFLHRLSFEPKPGLGGARRLGATDSGIEGVAGSTRNDELYVRSELRLRKDFDQPAFAAARFRRSEDFDGYYHEALVGLGIDYEGWEVSLHGDVQAAKENVDVHLRFGWSDPESDNRLHATIVAVDWLFNEKQVGGFYEQQPLTYHLAGSWQLLEPLTLYGFAAYNAPSRLIWNRYGTSSVDRQASAGIGLRWLPAEGWSLSLENEGLYGTRRTQASAGSQALDILFPQEEAFAGGFERLLTPGELLLLDRLNPGQGGLFERQGPPRQRLRRSYLSSTMEVVQDLAEGEQRWLGLRYFRLREDDRRNPGDWAMSHSTRREYTLYVGQRWQLPQLLPRLAVAPTLYVAYHDNHLEFPQSQLNTLPMGEQGFVGGGYLDQRDVGFYGKLAPAIEYTVIRESQAVISINPTIFLHRAAFGGGNVQVYIPF
ncbi:MAG: hypothetical protein EA402_00740 [Planctomycetota bacterium]|nr:MAG: hypothetical protein EA402_00740 [Planctomycetota bacterium]